MALRALHSSMPNNIQTGSPQSQQDHILRTSIRSCMNPMKSPNHVPSRFHSQAQPHQYQPFQTRQLPSPIEQQTLLSIVQQYPPPSIVPQYLPPDLHKPPPSIIHQPSPSIIHQPPTSILQHIPPSSKQEPPIPIAENSHLIQQQSPNSIELVSPQREAEMNVKAKEATHSQDERNRDQQYPIEMNPDEPGSCNSSEYGNETIKEKEAKTTSETNDIPVTSVAEQVDNPLQQISPLNKVLQQASSPQPQENVKNITNTLKKSTLNPKAKEFFFNPTAKSFLCRFPSTPLTKRPYAPQMPRINVSATVNGHSAMTPLWTPPHHVMNSQSPPNQQWHWFMRTDIAHQMQVTTATGQPLSVLAPIQHFMYQQTMNQMYPPIHMLGPFDPQAQYMPSNFLPSATGYQTEPPQYNRDQWPQPATHHPQGHQQFPPVYPIIPTQLQVMQSMQYMQQAPPPPQPLM